ncbi:MAG: hypothetical protein HY270_05490 [Deltaproteobacteria bacterium]|nr:hypothetical protein [Deltaproteobacteria bacterium]
MSWSDPIEDEIRDDQGISIKNPDTGLFMRYRLAGAYDSNIALLLATGATRAESFERITEILRKTTLRGIDLATNREFLYGLSAWFVYREVWAKPTTKFVVPYLTLVGELAAEAQSIDFDYAFQRIASQATAGATKVGDAAVAATRHALDLKETLLERPITMLVEEPHFLSAWLSQHRLDFSIEAGRVAWRRNPVEILGETYHCLQMDDRPGEPAAHRIWDHDQHLLETALSFYRKLTARIDRALAWEELDEQLRRTEPAFGFSPDVWQRIRAAHAGHQTGLQILDFLPLIAMRVGFFDLHVNDDLTITIPERLMEPMHQDAMRKILVPPPATRSDEIVAAMGGTFYAQEAPHLAPFVSAGTHFKQGDPLYIIEVMKMFNKVYATFSGTIDEILVQESGVVVRKGQPLFKVTPDDLVIEEDPQDRIRRMQTCTEKYLENLL